MDKMEETCQSNDMTSGLNNFMTLMNHESSHAITKGFHLTEKMWRSRKMQYKITDEFIESLVIEHCSKHQTTFLKMKTSLVLAFCCLFIGAYFAPSTSGAGVE